jgi:ribosomal protein S18 acetylase RimI-like enzyme
METTMAVTLRTALPADRDAVIELIHRLNVFEADLTGDRRRDYDGATGYYNELLQRLARRQGRIVLAEAGGVVIGAMGYSLDEDAAYVTDDVRRHGTVTDLIVHEEWRGRGIGQMLLREAERLTREAGLKRLVIGALVANEQAERTYRKFGFEPYVSLLIKEL